MRNILGAGAAISAAIGAIICLVAGLGRLSGQLYLAGFESLTLFTGGMGLMVFSIILKLEVIHRSLKGPGS